MRIVMLSSNADPDVPLDLDKEYNRLRERLEAARGTPAIELDYWPDVRLDQLASRLLTGPAHVLHFSGHATPSGGLLMRDHNGQARVFNPDGVARLIGTFGSEIRCVVLVACYSDALAERLADAVDVVIGMQSEVDDDAAILFVSSFYESLARGTSVGRAFAVASSLVCALGPDRGEPRLRTRSGVEADNVYLSQSRPADLASDNEELLRLITSANDRSVPLSRIMVEALSYASRVGDAELRQFATLELGGYKGLSSGVQPDEGPSHRTLYAYVSPVQVNLDYLGFGGSCSAALRYMESRPKEFARIKFLKPQALADIEANAARARPGTDQILHWVVTAGDISDRLTNRNVPIHCYASPDQFEKMLAAIRRELVERLVSRTSL